MAIDFPNTPSTGQSFTSGSVTWIYDGAKWNISTTTSAFAPTGTIITYAGTNLPNGWLPCDGSSRLQSAYPQLFALVGTTFGAGSSPGTTFALPDFRTTTGKFIIRTTDDSVTVNTSSSLIAVPVGAMQLFAMSTIPTGWLRANGSAVSRTVYADLFASIGTTYGTGDGSTTFNIPNISGSGAGSPLYYIKAILSGDVQPSTVSHFASHTRAGSDILDGDQLQVDFVPSNYSRNSGASGAGAVTDLTAHLSGLDSLSGSHASRHVRGGADIIDADRNQIDFVPTYYTRDSSPAQAGAVTDLSAHLKGVDNTLGTGRIVQALQAQSTQITVNTTTWTNIVSQTITTTKANAKLICMFTGDCNANDNGAWKRVGIFIDGTLQYNVLSSTANAAYQEVVSISGVFTVTTAGSHTVSIQAQQGAGSSTFAEEGGNHKNNLVVLELW